MNQPRTYDLKKRLAMIGLAPLLIGLLFGLVAKTGLVTDAAATGASLPGRALSTDLEVIKSAQSDADPANGNIVYNGDRITYTVSIRNLTTSPIHIDTVTDNLPAGVLFNVQCLQGTGCQVNNDTVTWQNFNVNSGATTLLKFTAAVGCLSSGAQISNQVGVTYGSSFLPSNVKVSTAQLKPVVLNASGRPLVDGPSGCSDEIEGYDQDWGDFDQDGDLDLALATASETVVYRNDGGQMVRVNSDSHRTFGVRWADVDGDGQLELIAVGDAAADAYGFQRGVNYIYDDGIFHTPAKTFNTTDVLWRVELADYDQNGTLDLAAASYIDSTAPTQYNLCLLRLYSNSGAASFTANECLIGPLTKDSVWTPTIARRSFSAAWADVDGNGALDLGVGDDGDPNRIHAGNGSILGAASTAIDGTSTENTTSLAWVDFDSDTDQDVAWGNDGQPARLYLNNGETLPGTTWSLAWSGPSNNTYDVAWGSIGSNLFLALGNYGQANELYLKSGATLTSALWSSTDGANTTGLAWVDFNQDNKLDLTASNFNQTVVGYASNGTTLNQNPLLLTVSNAPTRDLAWANWDGDADADLALANVGQPIQVYRNTGSFPMSLAWTASAAENSFSVAWADVDGDTYPDLAVGNNGSTNKLYQNDGGVMNSMPFWNAAETFNTRAVAWGDVDNDGDLDLAVANDNQRNALYLNRRYFRINPTTVKSLGQINDLAWGDYNNDGLPDLAIGGVDLQAPGGGFLYVIKNSSGALTFTKNGAIELDQDAPGPLTDLAWADYNRDGYQDLVGTLPDGQEIRFYQNLSGSGSWLTAISLNGPTAYALDWVDFQRDGWPDLALADSPGGASTTQLKIYLNQSDAGGSGNFVFNDLVKVNTSNSIVPSLRGIDRDNDGDLDLSAVDSQVQSQQYTTYGSFLNPRLADNTIDTVSFAASSVAWGDYDGDNRLDLLLGGSGIATRLYRNKGTSFCRAGSHPVTCPAGPTFDTGGRRAAIWGDFDSDGRLDIADGVPGGQVKLFRSDSATVQSINNVEAYTLAWGDGDGDGRLDLLVGGKDGGSRQSYLYFNQRQAPFLDSASSSWALATPQATVSMAWADFDNDTHLDFVIGNCNANLSNSLQLYRNNRDNTFSLVTGVGLPTSGYCTRSVAWADFDGDGDPDLAVGNDGAASFIYKNQGLFGGTFTSVWNSGSSANTTSLAWGDWNNDGKPDLALGNHGQKSRVYANFSTTSSAIFVWLWESKLAYKITGLAWGDKDGDGDLDLAFSQDGTDLNGIFENGYVSPAHLGDRYAPLPQNPTYLAVQRPDTAAAYQISSPTLVSPTVKIDYTVYDPTGDSIILSPTQFEYSLNGGGLWQTATLSGTTTHDGSTEPNGQAAEVIWDAAADGAIGDNALFRISVVLDKPVGPIQQAITRAVSPPFRVRGLTCQWPADPSIAFITTDPPANSTYSFSAGISSGAGNLTFEWDFGDGETALGQDKVVHIFETGQVYTVTLTVSGEACPVTREVVAATEITAGQITIPTGDGIKVYLPSLIKPGNAGATILARSSSAPQVSGFRGQIKGNKTLLTWKAAPLSDGALSYRVYRSPYPGPANFRLLATVPATITNYVDSTADCGYIYYVTSVDAEGESGASSTSFASGQCH